MLLAISPTQGSGGRVIAEKLARRLDMPCCDASLPGGAERAGALAAVGPCILLAGPGCQLPAGPCGLVRVLIHAGPSAVTEWEGDVRYDLAVDSGPLGEAGTVELLSQFVALKVMSLRGKSEAPGGRYG